MNITSPYTYTALHRTTDETGARYYVDPTGAHLSSVTTILSATADTKGIDAWRQFVGEKRANQIRDEATGLGSLMHEHLENHILNVARPRGNNVVRKMAENMADVVISQGLSKVEEVWGIEAPLYFPELFAGTADLIGVYEGKPCIMDFKTTNKMKTADMIGDYFCQLGAYAMAHDQLYGTEINTGVIFMVSRDLQFHTFVITGDDFDQSQQEWASRVDAFYASKNR